MSLAESLSVAVSWGGGGGGKGEKTPYDCPYREASPKSDTFSRLQAYKNAGISWAEVYERAGKFVSNVL